MGSRDSPTLQHPKIPTLGWLQQPELDLGWSRQEQMVCEEGALAQLSPWADRNILPHPVGLSLLGVNKREGADASSA